MESMFPSEISIRHLYPVPTHDHMTTNGLVWFGARAAWPFADVRAPEAFFVSLREFPESEREAVERDFAQGQPPEASRLVSFSNSASLNYLYQDFEPRDDDVYICTYAKSGTTLTQQIVYQLLFGPDDTYEDITRESPWWETCMGHEVMTQSSRYPRILKTHLRWEHFPSVVTSKDGPRGKFIFIEREMKDVFTSYLRHVRGFSSKPIEEETFAQSFVNGKMALGPYDGYIHGWRDHAPAVLGDHLLQLQFREMRDDLKGVIAKIAAFIGARTDEEHLEQVYQRCTLAYMGNPEHKAKFNHDWERRIMQRFAWEMAVLVVTENASSLA